MNDAAEARDVERYLDELSGDERSQFYAARKRHKELLCFLHEWAHTLGIEHDTVPASVMATSYSNRARGFPDDEVARMRHVLAERARGIAAIASPSAPSPPAPGDSRTGEALQRAYDLYKAGKGAEAMRALDGVRARIAPGSDDWENAVQIYAAAGALSRAADLVEQAPADRRSAQHRSDIERMRREAGLPAERARSGLAPEDEPAVHAAVNAAIGKLIDGDVAEARRLQAQLAKSHPQALATTLVACGVAAKSNQPAVVRRTCAAALSRWDELPYAHFWAGLHAAAPRERIAHLRRAIELTPDQHAAWQALARVYKETKEQTALEELRSDYRKRFRGLGLED
jgi:tetratricopeptide (TPR) repeat protein